LKQTGEKSPLNDGGNDLTTKGTAASAGAATSEDGWLTLFVVADGGNSGNDGTFFDRKGYPNDDDA
jgi:hypothetical protein